MSAFHLGRQSWQGVRSGEGFEWVQITLLDRVSASPYSVRQRRFAMVISSSEAAAALRDVAQTDRRTRVSGAYHVASPHLILWGLIWVAGYSGCGLMPAEQWGLVWLPLILI